MEMGLTDRLRHANDLYLVHANYVSHMQCSRHPIRVTIPAIPMPMAPTTCQRSSLTARKSLCTLPSICRDALSRVVGRTIVSTLGESPGAKQRQTQETTQNNRATQLS
jgi:hypothetical protein